MFKVFQVHEEMTPYMTELKILGCVAAKAIVLAAGVTVLALVTLRATHFVENWARRRSERKKPAH